MAGAENTDMKNYLSPQLILIRSDPADPLTASDMGNDPYLNDIDWDGI